MPNQGYRTQIEQVTLTTERNAKDLVKLRDQLLKQIKLQLPADKKDLVEQYLQLQYQLDDAMYLSIYQAGLNHGGVDQRKLVS